MTITVTRAPQTSFDEFNKPIFGAKVTALVMRTQREPRTTNIDGDQITVRDVLISHDEFLKHDAIWLPGLSTSDDANAHQAKNVIKYEDADGETLYEVLI